MIKSFIVEQEVKALLLDDPVLFPDMYAHLKIFLQDVVYHYSSEGLSLAMPDGVEELIPLGYYLMFEPDGRLLVISKEGFESKATEVKNEYH